MQLKDIIMKSFYCFFSVCLISLIVLTTTSATPRAVQLSDQRAAPFEGQTSVKSSTATARLSQIFANGQRPLGTCNLPPIPAPGQTVTWTLADSPYEICQNITIPSTSTVIVEAGVHINFDPDMQVVVLGTMQLQGQAGQHIVLQAPLFSRRSLTLMGAFLTRRSQISPARCAWKTVRTWHSLTVPFRATTLCFGRRSCRLRGRSSG